MHRFFVTSLSIYWAVVFGLGALGVLPHSIGVPIAVPAVLAVGHALVCALFSWNAVAVLVTDPHAGSNTGSVAFACAALMLTLDLMVDAVTASQPLDAGAIQIAALGVTWLVVRGEGGEQKSPSKDYSSLVARRLAVGAAHGTMLTRLSRRGPDAMETDA